MEKYQELMNKLERNKQRFPHLSSLWKNYLIKKKEHLESQIIACDTMFNMMEKDNTDITVPTFLILYMIYNRQLT
tara:strand:+ start:3608 stop:3832 length:225 start_codon:yes stop_codon:yes gene_type:complete